MAPTTRSSFLGRSHSETAAQSFSDSLEGADDEDMYSEQEDDEPSQSSLQDFLQPLQETADRVSQQVEEFAKRLHKFNTDRASGDQTLWEDAWTLLDDFRGIAHTRAEATSTRNPRSSRRRSAGDSGIQLAKIDLEADIWDLTKRMLMCKSPRAAVDAQSAQEERLKELHRYSTDSELWNAFLDSDITGQEYESVLDWLQERAQKTEPPIEDTIQNLTEKSERGHGVWSAGPMFTKNSIKQQKRSRGLASPLEPSNNSQPKVSQLDPDAQTRQNASLEDQDEFHEEAAWMTCWELLRRGKSLEDVRSWWTDRNEQWRSLALRGCLTMSIDEIESPWYRIMSLASNPSWVAQCRTLCRSNALSNAFQRAVYGILCGDAPASHEVCNGIDEHLFATFNALLIERYQHYAAAYRKKLASNNSATYQPPIVDQNSVRRAVQSATATVRGRVGMQETHKATQMAIMDTDFDTFFVAVGRAAAEFAYSSKDVFRHLMSENIDNSNIPTSAMNIVGDFDSARVVAHMQIVMRSLGLLPSYEQNEYLMENNITSYIGWLQKDKKWDLIPTYASHLSKQRIQMVLGTIFINITDEKERALQVRLLKKYKIDVAEVLYGIFALANYQNLTRFQSPNFHFSAPRITELNGTGKAALLKLKHEFMGLEPSPEDERIVSSVEWYRHTEAPNWGKACYSISFLYKLWLCEGNLEAAKMLPERANLADISLNALGMNLMFGEDTEEAEADLHTNEKSEDTPDHSLSPSRSRKVQQLHPLARGVSTRKALFDQSVVWMHLEQLVTALDALNTFQAWADDLDSVHKDNVAELKGYKHNLRKSLTDAQDAMSPVLARDFLCHPLDEAEAKVLGWIRHHYLTEAVLGYNSVLYFAGHSLSRSHLVECMSLAQIVAQTPSLTQAFVDSGKMRELVRSFALDSQSLLLANEQPKKTGSKKEKGLEIWQIDWKKQELNLEDLD